MPILTDEIKAKIVGTEYPSVSEEIEKGHMKKWAESIYWPDPPPPLFVDEEYAKKTKWGGIIAPPTYFTALGRGGQREAQSENQIETLLPPARVGMNGGNEFEVFGVIRPGDVITSKRKIVDIYERTGRSGSLIFTISETTWTNQKGEVIGISRGTGIRQY